LLLLVCARAAGQRPDELSKEELAIRQAAKNYIEALNKGDLKELLACWLPDGDYVNARGERFRAHDLIQREFAQPAAEPQEPRAFQDDAAIRLLTADVALEEGLNGPPMPGTDSGRASYTAIWVKRDGRWLLAAVRECLPAIVAASSPLERLAWLVGTWSAKADDREYEFVVRRAEGGHFLVGHFKVRRNGETVVQGSQRIGWDAANKTIRSWVFDSQGGYGEAIWGNEGNTWFVDNKGSTADGHRVESIDTYTLNDDGTLTWRVENLRIDGQSMPEVTIKYQKNSR
jgi:uncharacterized protein (TIGR02246 family)